MTVDTTVSSYWLNWRFLLCAICIFLGIVLSFALIWRYEGFKDSDIRKRDGPKKKAGIVYKDESWKTYSKKIHPIWLLAYRVIALCILLAVLIGNTVVHSPRTFYYYTEWTFTLVTVYFALASIFSIYGCLHCQNEIGGADSHSADAEKGTYIIQMRAHNVTMSTTLRRYSFAGETHVRETANVWGYAFQIIFQVCAGSVVLTDVVFWGLLYPFLTDKDYQLHLLNVCMHSVNAAVLLGEVILNSLRFPFFRVAYFGLWTIIFVIFQWIFHAFNSMQWPYTFLDLSSQYAPAWYLAVGLLTLPCFYVFAIIIKIKKWCWSRLFPVPEPSLNVL